MAQLASEWLIDYIIITHSYTYKLWFEDGNIFCPVSCDHENRSRGQKHKNAKRHWCQNKNIRLGTSSPAWHQLVGTGTHKPGWINQPHRPHGLADACWGRGHLWGGDTISHDRMWQALVAGIGFYMGEGYKHVRTSMELPSWDRSDSICSAIHFWNLICLLIPLGPAGD